MTNVFPFTVIFVILLQSTSVPAGRAALGREQDLTTLRRQAEAGDAKAQVQLGLAYASGDGVAADEAEAVRWFRKAAEKGDASGEYFLSEMYLTGRGVTVDMAEAVKWLKRSAEHGDARGQSNLAVLYVQGQGVPKDEAEATKWMRKAADQGDASAMNNLAFLLAASTDPKVRNPKEAVAIAEKAVDAEPANPSYLDPVPGHYSKRTRERWVLSRG